MFPHILPDPAILGGKPCVKGTRLSVDFLLELVADGASVSDITQAYPHLAPAEVAEALQYARHSPDVQSVLSGVYVFIFR